MSVALSLAQQIKPNTANEAPYKELQLEQNRRPKSNEILLNRIQKNFANYQFTFGDLKLPKAPV